MLHLEQFVLQLFSFHQTSVKMGKLALLLELCQGLSSTTVNWYPTCGNGHWGPQMIYASSGLECWNQSESQVSQNRAEQPGIRQLSQHSLTFSKHV